MLDRRIVYSSDDLMILVKVIRYLKWNIRNRAKWNINQEHGFLCGLVVWIESICIVCRSFCLVPIGQWAGWYKQFFLNFPGCCILKVEGMRFMLQCLYIVAFFPFFLTVQWFFGFDFADRDGDCNKDDDDDDDDDGRLKAWQPQWEDWALPISSARTPEKKLREKSIKLTIISSDYTNTDIDFTRNKTWSSPAPCNASPSAE